MKKIILGLMAIALLASCKKDDLKTLGGEQSPMGAIGNEFFVSHSITGLSDVIAVVNDRNNGVSEVVFTATITNPQLAAIANFVSGIFPSNIIISGNDVAGEVNFRFTNEGIAAVFPGYGELIYVKYNAKVGDKYSLKIDDNFITHEVAARSTTDDYMYGFFLIKTIKVVGTGYGYPGVSKIEYHFNHRFGLVGFKVFFDDLSTINGTVYSDNEN